MREVIAKTDIFDIKSATTGEAFAANVCGRCAAAIVAKKQR
jgi:hypothetical protein